MTDEIFRRLHASNVSEEEPNPRREGFELLNEPWCRELFLRPDFEFIPLPNRRPLPPVYKWCTHSMLSQTLWTNEAIRACCMFTTSDPSNSVYPKEVDVMMAIGSGLDGMTGRAFGGFISFLFDFAMGFAAETIHKANTTLNLEVDYKKPIPTPCLLLCRSKAEKIEGRTIQLTSTLEDGKGKIFAAGKSKFMRPKGYEGDGDPRGKNFLTRTQKPKL